MANDGTFRHAADFASSDLWFACVSCNAVVFLYLYSPKNHLWWRHVLLEISKIMETFIHRGDSFKITLKNSADVSFYFYLQLYKTIIEWLLSYDVTLIRKCKKVVPEEVPEK